MVSKVTRTAAFALSSAMIAFVVCTASLGLSNNARAASDKVVASVDGHQVTEQEVNAKIKPQLSAIESQLYEVKKNAAEQIIDDYLIEKAAAKAKLSKAEFEKREIEDKVPAATDEELQKFYDQHKDQIRQPLDKIKPALSSYLKNKDLADRRKELVTQLRSAAKYKMMLVAPRIEVASDGFPALGHKDAPITIVEFSDFQCPFCKRAEEPLNEIRKKYGEKLRLVYRDYPLPIHNNAMKASEAGQCANEQNKFWQFHDALFADQSKLDVTNLKATAAKLDLDTNKFNDCLDHDKYQSGVQKDLTEGNNVGVTGTPAFFINGRVLSGAQPPEAFEEIIDEELTRSGQKQASAEQ